MVTDQEFMIELLCFLRLYLSVLMKMIELLCFLRLYLSVLMKMIDSPAMPCWFSIYSM